MSYEENFDHTARWDAESVREAEHTHRSTRSAAERQRLKKKGQRRRFTLWLAFVLIVSAILAGVGWLLANDMCSFNKSPVETTIEITRDDNLDTIATKLHDDGLIQWCKEKNPERKAILPSREANQLKWSLAHPGVIPTLQGNAFATDASPSDCGLVTNDGGMIKTEDGQVFHCCIWQYEGSVLLPNFNPPSSVKRKASSSFRVCLQKSGVIRAPPGSWFSPNSLVVSS